MQISKNVLDKLNSKDYPVAQSCLRSIIKRKAYSDNDILKILKIRNKLIITDFLSNQYKFSQSNLIVIEGFINKNINHKNNLFASDLVEFATDFNLSLNYDKCINLIRIYKNEEHYLLMALMEYVFYNMKIIYFTQIIEAFEFILHNKKIDESARVKAAFYLYRISFKKGYLDKLKEISKKNLYNKEILFNLLKIDSNTEKHFEGYKTVKALVM